MYFSQEEEKVIKLFYSYLSNRQFNNEIFLLKWKNGTIVKAKFLTDDNDDNGLDFEDKNYEEYCSFIMDVIDVLNFSSLDGFDPKWVKNGGSIDFNYHNFPDEIYNSKGELISKKED